MDKLFTNDPEFYRQLRAIAVPVALQNLITVGVSMLDTLMLGTMGEVQLETREKLRENTRDHGTKGGVLEKGCIFFERYLRQPLEEETRRVLAGRGSDDFFDFAEGMSFTISLAALRQSYRLAGGR